MNHNEDMDKSDDDPIEIPPQALAPETLTSVLESFILREGTDYGAAELTHEQKVQRLRAAVERGEARIVYQPSTASVTILPR